ncbi:hypothetical protein VTJ04DRAFT_1129 [Mycothermus thermophilus]|uniref:uncharacterized protein n=1 Tax=Humicola insolens TaxID=85995 RepID=UPI00374307A1
MTRFMNRFWVSGLGHCLFFVYLVLGLSSLGVRTLDKVGKEGGWDGLVSGSWTRQGESVKQSGVNPTDGNCTICTTTTHMHFVTGACSAWLRNAFLDIFPLFLTSWRLVSLWAFSYFVWAEPCTTTVPSPWDVLE